ncbi:MAG: sugar transferase [Acidobacteria bacterium]|nr:sugar transferase [Acidobacteriota bacterium]
MFTRRTRLLRFLLIVSELVLLALSFELAYLFRSHLPRLRLFYFSAGEFAGLLLASLVLWAAIGMMHGVYRGPLVHDAQRILRLTVAQTFWFGVTLATAIYLFKLGDISRSFVGLHVSFNFILQVAYRLSGRRMRDFLQRGFAGPRFYLIVGTGPKALEVARLIEKDVEHGDRVLGFVREPEADQSEQDPNGAPASPGLIPQEPLLDHRPAWKLEEVPRMIEEHIIDEVILAVSKPQLEKMEDLLLACEEQGIKTRVLVDFFPHFRSEISLDRLEKLPLLTFSSAPENEYLLFLKRGLDLALALLLLVLTAPLMVVVAALVKVTSPGPVIYRQVRCGLNGRTFLLYKFRSMYEGAHQDQPLLAHLNEMDGPAFKISRDPRVTRLGRSLRKTSLDELPQLLNILKGDMSFVGPRPPLPQEVARYEKWQRRRLRMKPGLTCLWALEGRNELDFVSWMKLDMEYIDQWSLALDFKILLWTIPRVLSGRGAS